MNTHYLYLFSAVYICSHQPIFAQTVGNGSAIGPSAAQTENYGVNAPENSNKAESAYSTRHYHWGNRTGIGGSFNATESVTAESSPAIKTVRIVPVAPVARLRAPTIKSVFPEAGVSPALESLDYPAPMSGRSSALSNPVVGPPSFSTSNIESMPSFNKNPSMTDNMQFNNFGSSANLGF